MQVASSEFEIRTRSDREGPAVTAIPHSQSHYAPADSALQPILDESATLQGLMQQLTTLADDKLRFMRAADVAALEDCAAREAELIREVCTRETAWKAALARLAQQLPPGATEGPTLQEMVNRFSEPLRSRALARIGGLEHSARQLRKKNEIAAAVARNLQEHLRGAFATIAAPPADRPTYGRPGQPATVPSRSWVDAFG